MSEKTSTLRSYLPQDFGSPLVDAFSPYTRCGRNGGVDFGRNVQHESAGIGFLWLSALFLADGDVGIDGFVKSSLKLVNRCSMKTDDVLYADKMADKYAVVLVEFNVGGVTSILHCVHSPMPSRSVRVAPKAEKGVPILHYSMLPFTG